MGNFNWIDLFIITALIRGGYIGFKRGTTNELIRLLATIFMVVISIQFYTKMSKSLETRFLLPAVPAQIASFGILVLVAYLLTKMFVDFLQDFIKFKFTATVDKVCGLCFGTLRGLLFASIILILFHISEIEELKLGVMNSISGGLTKDFAFYLHSLFFY
ncbi:MAG: CvpA family protein [Candidatus Omnitrophica bacterium]|nr:CvpA family protein [Candidatus Omnitrophota bacterium]